MGYPTFGSGVRYGNDEGSGGSRVTDRGKRLILRAVGSMAAIGLLAVWPALGSTSGAQQSPVFTLTPRTQTVDLSSGTANVEVRIEGVTDLAAFEFVLRYDTGVLEQPSVQPGPFLGSTGRQVTCLNPRVDSEEHGPGTLQYACVTTALGDGVSGSGLLATVTFELAGGASTPLVFDKATATNANADSRCAAATCPVQHGSVNVAGGKSEQQVGLAPTPTPISIPTGPTPVGQTVSETHGPSAPGSSGSSAPANATGASNSGGASPGSSSGSTAAGDAGSGMIAPRVGSLGSPVASKSGISLAVQSAVALALAGAGLAACAIAVRATRGRASTK